MSLSKPLCTVNASKSALRLFYSRKGDDMTLILASSSPSRRTLLERLKLPFEAIAPDIDESAKPGEGMQQLVSRLSQEKAQRVAAHHPDAFVIGCDQLVSVKDRILGKPHTEEVARTHLQWCSGQKLLSLTAMGCHAPRSFGRAKSSLPMRQPHLQSYPPPQHIMVGSKLHISGCCFHSSS